jgi:hypothetical protein
MIYEVTNVSQNSDLQKERNVKWVMAAPFPKKRIKESMERRINTVHTCRGRPTRQLSLRRQSAMIVISIDVYM